ncbi:hypothetical protein HN51_050128 [Arachis hypogaea]|uniref:Protein DCL n=1 Tax=Arachis hypogaea TaxID=3818 RepID=A0A444YCN1_ARAHY|nr:protein DCL, chloroplastic [Arachis ipaensis]XP_020963002.1 protein DCL, chloroplastic [Arachis ipaensis]XP_025667919.1 protein DCL homolog, chloroplastic [Arachis hypogaea]XP_025667920.1 protein DCL homolog, chloroplastic [Arachis hypogaea]QHN91794.1 uncharacterized protein DS421_17g578010 [Arachis hypogaea]RYQ99666.1 hypothetical protein Ahy_B07g087637 [Arachis hypogaea]
MKLKAEETLLSEVIHNSHFTMTGPLLLRQFLLHHRLLFRNFNGLAVGAIPPPPPRRLCCCSTVPSDQADDNVTSTSSNPSYVWKAKEASSSISSFQDDPEFRKWKDKEEEILKDIQPIVLLTKDILHSRRYMDGEQLSAEDERAVVDNLLAYHPRSEDKIGCGLESIMVDRHPQFRQSRCLFVVRTDGGWIDFSYQKCLREYIRDKYPMHAERFIREHFRRGRE